MVDSISPAIGTIDPVGTVKAASAAASCGARGGESGGATRADENSAALGTKREGAKASGVLDLDEPTSETITNDGCVEVKLDEIASETIANEGCIEVELDETESEEGADEAEAPNSAEDVAREDSPEVRNPGETNPEEANPTADNGYVEVDLGEAEIVVVELEEAAPEAIANDGCVEVELDESETDEQTDEGGAPNSAEDMARDDSPAMNDGCVEIELDEDEIEVEEQANKGDALKFSNDVAREEEEAKPTTYDPVCEGETDTVLSAVESHTEDDAREDETSTALAKEHEEMRDPPPAAEASTHDEEARADVLDEVTPGTIVSNRCIEVKLSESTSKERFVSLTRDEDEPEDAESKKHSGEEEDPKGDKALSRGGTPKAKSTDETSMNSGCVEVKLSEDTSKATVIDDADAIEHEDEVEDGVDYFMSERVINQICHQAELDRAERMKQPGEEKDAKNNEDITKKDTPKARSSEWKFILSQACEDEGKTLLWSQSLFEEVEDIEGYLSCMEAERSENDKGLAGIKRHLLGGGSTLEDVQEEEEYYTALVSDAVMESHVAELERRRIELIQLKSLMVDNMADKEEGRREEYTEECMGGGSLCEDGYSLGYSVDYTLDTNWSYENETFFGVFADMFRYNCGLKSSRGKTVVIPNMESMVSKQEGREAARPSEPQ